MVAGRPARAVTRAAPEIGAEATRVALEIGSKATRTEPTPAGRGLVAAARCVLAATCGILVATCGGGGDDNGTGAAEAARRDPGVRAVYAAAADAPVRVQDFAGSDACRECHADQYERWAGSTHGRAGGPPSPETVLAPFDGTPIVFQDGSVVPEAGPEGYRFVVRQNGRPKRTFSVDGVVGGGHMVGGGTQGFLTRAADGTVRFLPFDWSRQLGAWFCNTGGRLDQGWLPVAPSMALADCGDWPPVRVMGTLPRFANCQGCHGSQVQAAPTPGEGVATRWTSLAINCESCHGPARRHAAIMEAASAGTPIGDASAGGSPGTPIADPASIGLPSRVLDGLGSSLETCFQCHALKDATQNGGYLPGRRLADYYALKLPVLGDDPYLPDGRVRTLRTRAPTWPRPATWTAP